MQYFKYSWLANDMKLKNLQTKKAFCTATKCISTYSNCSIINKISTNNKYQKPLKLLKNNTFYLCEQTNK